MKIVVGIVAALVVVLGLFAAIFVLPTVQLKSSLGKLLASLPPGYTFTYGDAHYAFFAKRIELDNAVLKIASPAMEIQADSIEIDNGNPDLQTAIAQAAQTPDLNNTQATPIASRIILTNIHTGYAPLDVHANRAEMDNVSMDLHQALSPLPHADTTSNANEPYPNVLQKIALYTVATAYKHGEIDDIIVDVQATGTNSQALKFRADALTSDGFDHGNIGDTVLRGFDVASGTFDMHIDRIAAGDTLHRDFWTALRDGASLDAAAETFQGANQEIDTVKVTSNGQPTASLDKLTLSNITYHAGLPASLNVQMTNLNLDPAILSNADAAAVFMDLGYKTITLNGSINYAWDQAAKTIRLDPAQLVMDQGGSLTLTANIIDADAKLPFPQYKIADASLRYDDAGFVTKWLDHKADQSHNTTARIKAVYIQWLAQQKPALAKGPAFVAAIPALQSFINDPHSLLITLTPPHPMLISDFNLDIPHALGNEMGLKVTAPGSGSLPVVTKPAKQH